MPRIIGLLVLFLATLTLGGCAGMPLDYGNGAGGYGGSCPQAYGAMTPGYAAAGPAVIYAPQPQPYYAPQPYAYYSGAYGPAPLPPQADPTARPWIDHRERDQEARSRQARRDGSLTPYAAQRQWAEPGPSRGAEGRMRADGNFSPQNDRGRLNTGQNRTSQDIYGARHNGMGQPGATGPQRNGTVGPMGSVRQPQINGGQTHGGMQPQARSMQPGPAPRARGIAEATPGQ